jgi:branched-chain amino acid transport system substrate-binding protein
MKKQRFYFKTLLFAAVLLFSASVWAAEPIKIGCIEPLSGKFKQVGQPLIEGVQFAAKEINQNGGLLGRKVEIVPIESEMKPEVAARNMQKAILQDRIKFFGKGLGSKDMGVMIDLAQEHHVIAISWGTEAASLTGEKCSRNFFRVCLNTDMHSNALAIWAAKSGKKKFFCIAPDYSFGKEAVAAFKKKLEKLNPSVEIAGEIYHKLGESDFAPHISGIMNTGAELVFTPSWGADLRLLIKQSGDMGLKARFLCYYLDDKETIEAIANDDAVIGNITSEMYMLGIPTEANKKFIDAFYNNFKFLPSYRHAKAYMGVMFWAEAVKKAGSDDVDAVIKAWEGLSYDSLVGKQYMRPYDHQNQVSAWLAEIVKENRFYKHPYVGEATMIPAKDIAVPEKETGCPGLAK